MWNKVGVVRNGKDLQAALAELKNLRDRTKRQSAHPGLRYNLEWNEALDVINICLNAELVARGALIREESRGSHYRTDYPDRNPQWLKRIRLQRRADSTDIGFIPLSFHRMAPPELREPISTTYSGA